MEEGAGQGEGLGGVGGKEEGAKAGSTAMGHEDTVGAELGPAVSAAEGLSLGTDDGACGGFASQVYARRGAGGNNFVRLKKIRSITIYFQ